MSRLDGVYFMYEVPDMCDQWMPTLSIAMPIEEFHQMPRNAGYKYEYLGGQALLTPRPMTHHAKLDLATFSPQPNELAKDTIAVAEFRDADRDDAVAAFAASFSRVQPFAGIDDEVRRVAARTCLERTWSGVDGVFVPSASFTARDQGKLVGALLITLLPPGDLSDSNVYSWSDPPVADLWEKGEGHPHLTWIFVRPFDKGKGVGTSLLLRAANLLRGRGYPHLLSTFITGNESSILWHWRCGFELLPFEMSRRRLKR